MAGGKNHGGGGHGRHGREQQRKYRHEIAVNEKLARAKASKERWLERKKQELDTHAEHLSEIASTASKRIVAFATKRQKKHQGLIMLLAVDAWRHEQMVKKAKELKIDYYIEPEEFHYIAREKREEIWNEIIGTKTIFGIKVYGRNAKDAKEELQKWKGRIVRIAQGQYL